MYAADLLEIGRQRFVQIEVRMGVQEHHGHVTEQRFGVRPLAAKVLAAHRRGREVHVLEVHVDRDVVDDVPHALDKRHRLRVRRVQRGDVRRVGRAVKRVLIPGQHLAGHYGHVRHAQVTGQVQIAPGRQQLGDHQVVVSRAQREPEVRVFERRLAHLPLDGV